MNGLNASVSGEWYTFTNLGPLTTTFTPDASCTAATMTGFGSLYAYNTLWIDYQAKCTDTIDYSVDCMPTTTPAPTTTTTTTVEQDPYTMSDEEYYEYQATHIEWLEYGSYYSPGVACPSGWETVGLVGRDGGDEYTVSGALAPSRAPTTRKTRSTTRPTATPTGTDDDYYYYDYGYDSDYDYDYVIDPASILKSALAPRQTMAVCCPSGMTIDGANNCYASIKDYKPTTGCNVRTNLEADYTYSIVTETYTSSSGETYTDLDYSYITTGTITEVTTQTTKFKTEDLATITAFSYAPAVTLLHHETDVAEAEGASAETPSNAAGRLGAKASSWDGLASVAGIWGVAVVMGAVMVLPW